MPFETGFSRPSWPAKLLRNCVSRRKTFAFGRCWSWCSQGLQGETRLVKFLPLLPRFAVIVQFCPCVLNPSVIHLKSSVIVYLYQLNVAPQIFFPAHNEFPRNNFITNNHLDHASELPLLFLFESERRHLAGEPRLRVLSGPEVQHKLKTCRLDEMLHLYTLVSHESPVICAKMQCFSI